MTILVTGAAGFIGYHTAKYYCEQGQTVLGIDNLNDYYSIDLKKARLSNLEQHQNFRFIAADINDFTALFDAISGTSVTHIIHLAAQAGVRYSLKNPNAYVQSNLVGHVNMLELARTQDKLEHFIYASSSSVYGANTKQPFAETDPVNTPLSLYAATKRSNELLSQSYAHLYNLPQTGLRFFTVYGPWGRPDMAPWLFTDAIFNDRPINVFNNGDMARDFTYIDDIIDGVKKVVNSTPSIGDNNTYENSPAPHRLYNLGNNQPEQLMDFIACMENEVGKKAIKIFDDIQDGDVKETSADISSAQHDLGFKPKTSMQAGMKKFVDWFRSYHNLT